MGDPDNMFKDYLTKDDPESSSRVHLWPPPTLPAPGFRSVILTVLTCVHEIMNDNVMPE